MKKTFITVAVVVILAFAMIVSASAASFEHLADDLKALGLFQGSDAGYELERAPNRGEALVMLIRLLGLEEEALAFEGDSPFTDVPAWLSPYVAYAFENGLTTGTSDTTFSNSNACNAQMYSTFVLRALGYSDAAGGDFAYADAVDFGKKVGIIDDLLADGDFLRDQMVAVSYLALLAAPKGGEFECLLEKLVDSEAVAGGAASALISKWALFAEFDEIIEKLINEPAIAASVKAGIDPGGMGALLAAAGMDLNIGIDADLALIRGDNMSAAIDITMARTDDSQEIGIYLKDGNIYANIGDDKITVDLITAAAEAGVDPGEMLSMISFIDVSMFSHFSYVISNIAKSADGSLTVYTIKPAAGLVDTALDMLINLLLDAAIGDRLPAGMDLGDMDVSLDRFDMKFYVDSDGMLNNCLIDVEASVGLDMSGLAIKVTLKISCEADITAVGDDVKVTFPDDLDAYELRSIDELTAAFPLSRG